MLAGAQRRQQQDTPAVIISDQLNQLSPSVMWLRLVAACTQGHDWSAIWERIQQLIVKSLISVQPILRNNYRSVLPPDNDGFSCFEILG